MAFDFMDLFPDSQAAVVGSQGARDIIDNQYKSAMGAMEMENALMRTIQAKKQMEEQKRIEPLAKTVEQIKLMQGLNLPGTVQFTGQDLTPEAMDQFLRDQLTSGQIKSNYQADLDKANATGNIAMQRALLTSGVSASNKKADISSEESRQQVRMAQEAVNSLMKKNGFGSKHMISGKPKNDKERDEIEAGWKQLIPYANSDSPAVKAEAERYWIVHSPTLSPKGYTDPLGNTRLNSNKPGEGKKEGPPTIVIKGHTFQKVNGQIVMVN